MIAGNRAIITVLCYQYWWLAGGYGLEIGHVQKWLGMVVNWWIVAFLCRSDESGWYQSKICYMYMYIV